LALDLLAHRGCYNRAKQFNGVHDLRVRHRANAELGAESLVSKKLILA
jgi:hypothetical protein